MVLLEMLRDAYIIIGLFFVGYCTGEDGFIPSLYMLVMYFTGFTLIYLYEKNSHN